MHGVLKTVVVHGNPVGDRHAHIIQRGAGLCGKGGRQRAGQHQNRSVAFPLQIHAEAVKRAALDAHKLGDADLRAGIHSAILVPVS